jgi:hypothetical protein
VTIFVSQQTWSAVLEAVAAIHNEREREEESAPFRLIYLKVMGYPTYLARQIELENTVRTLFLGSATKSEAFVIGSRQKLLLLI